MIACVSLSGLGCNRSPREATPDAASDQSRDPAPAGEADPKTVALDEEQREYLWQIEHHGNLLVKHGFGPLKQDLARDDAQPLARLRPRDFPGPVFAQPGEARLRNNFIQVVRQQETDQPRISLDAVSFLERLLAYRRSFGQPPKVAISLMKLAPE